MVYLLAQHVPSLAVSPLVITTGALGAMVVIGIVAVLLLIGCTWSVAYIILFTEHFYKQDTIYTINALVML